MGNEGLQAFLNLIGSMGVSWSPRNFTATYASGTTLTLTGLPSVPALWLGVWELPTSGLPKFWPARDNAFSFVSATGVLTVAGASFAAASTFVVMYGDKIASYDQVLDVLQTVEMAARQLDWVDSQTLLSAVAINNNDTGWVVIKGQTRIRLYYMWVSGTGDAIHSLTINMYDNPTDAGTDEYLEKADNLGTQVNGAAQTVKMSEFIDVSGCNRVKFKVDESGGTGKGTITLAVVQQNP